MTSIHFGKIIKDLRIDSGMSQEQVAQKIKMSQETISYHENSPTPPLDVIIKYVAALPGRNLTDVFGRDNLTADEQELITHYRKAPEPVKTALLDILRAIKK